MGRHLRSLGGRALAVLATAAWLAFLAHPALAQMSDRGGGLSRSGSSRSSSSREMGSSRSSAARASRASSRDDVDIDVDADDDDSGSSRSSSRRSSSSRSSGSGGTRSFSTGGSGKGGGSAPTNPPIVFGSKFERDGVRPRGTLLSVATFEALPCTPEPLSVGADIYYRCGEGWFQRIEHEGWTCYSEIWPPAGAHVSSLPSDHIVAQSGGRTVYAAENAWFERQSGGYVVIEPPIGLEIDRLPQNAKSGIPVTVNGVDYYRHLGVFYREQPGGRYVVATSPFNPAPVAAAQPATVPMRGAASMSLDTAGSAHPFVPAEPSAPMASTPAAPPAATTNSNPYWDAAAVPSPR